MTIGISSSLLVARYHLAIQTCLGAPTAWPGWMAPSTPAAAQSAASAIIPTALVGGGMNAASPQSLQPTSRAAFRLKLPASKTRAQQPVTTVRCLLT